MFRHRNEHLAEVCQKHNDPFRPEYQSLHSKPKGPGTEVVLIPGDPPAVVCIPHKVGSHAWGEFSRALEAKFPERMEKMKNMNWTERARTSRLVVVVRHPLERLVSAYRMIFQDWCDQNKFIRKQWSSICSKEALSGKDKSSNLWEKLLNLKKDPHSRLGILNGGTNADHLQTSQKTENTNTNSQATTRNTDGLPGLLSALYDEHIHGADRYIGHIWDKFHPEKETDNNNNIKDKYKFSMNEFVRFLVNSTKEFAEDQYVLQHSQLSYHWAPYWSECPLCSQPPHYILHMETLQEDLHTFLKDIQLSQFEHLFPHTHSQQGGHSSEVSEKFLQDLNPNEMDQLYEKYQLDHQLFGYSYRTE